MHGTCNEGKPGEILSNLCGQFSGDISGSNTGLCTTTVPLCHNRHKLWKQLNTEPSYHHTQHTPGPMYLFVYITEKIRDNELMGILVRSH